MDNECKVCGGELGLLGRLGWVLHLFCRNCGMQFSRDAIDFDDEDEEDYYAEFE